MRKFSVTRLSYKCLEISMVFSEPLSDLYINPTNMLSWLCSLILRNKFSWNSVSIFTSSAETILCTYKIHPSTNIIVNIQWKHVVIVTPIHRKLCRTVSILQVFGFHFSYSNYQRFTVSNPDLKLTEFVSELICVGVKHKSLSMNWELFTLFTPLPFCVLTFPLPWALPPSWPTVARVPGMWSPSNCFAAVPWPSYIILSPAPSLSLVRSFAIRTSLNSMLSLMCLAPLQICFFTSFDLKCTNMGLFGLFLSNLPSLNYYFTNVLMATKYY